MKKLVTAIAILISSLSYAQYNEKALYIHYVETFEFKFDREFKLYEYRNRQMSVLPEYRRNSNDIFIVGNNNRVNILYKKNEYKVPKTENKEYNKTNTFNPNKTLQEILRRDKK